MSRGYSALTDSAGTPSSSPAKADGSAYLDADEVIAAARLAGAREAGDEAAVVHRDAAVPVRRWIRDQRHRHEPARLPVAARHGVEIDVGQGIAVDDQERTGVTGEQRQRVPRPARGPEHRLLPRVADAGPEVGAVANRGGNRRRLMMQVQDEVGQSVRHQPADCPPCQRLAVHRHGRFRPQVGERPQTGPESGGQHEGAAAHRGPSKIMSGPVRPRAARSRRNRPR